MQGQVRGGEDVIFKQVSRLFRDELLTNYGWEPMEITAEVPTALPFTVGERRPDFLFRLSDGNLLHLEFQSTPARAVLAALRVAAATPSRRRSGTSAWGRSWAWATSFWMTSSVDN